MTTLFNKNFDEFFDISLIRSRKQLLFFIKATVLFSIFLKYNQNLFNVYFIFFNLESLKKFINFSVNCQVKLGLLFWPLEAFRVAIKNYLCY